MYKKGLRVIALVLSFILFLTSAPVEILAQQTETNYVLGDLEEEYDKDLSNEEQDQLGIEDYEPEDEIHEEVINYIPELNYATTQSFGYTNSLSGWETGLVGNLNNDRHSVEVIDNNTIKMKSGINAYGEFIGDGRMSANEDAFLFHYKEVNKNDSFRISTTVKVDGIPDQSVSNPGQIGFGIIIKDDISINNSTHSNNSNYIGVGHLNTSNNALGMRGVYKTEASENPSINGTRTTLGQFKAERPVVNGIYDLSLEKIGDNYKVTIDQQGSTLFPIVEYITIPNLFTGDDITSSDNIYVGLFTARGVEVTYSNIEFETIENSSNLISLELLNYPIYLEYYAGQNKALDLTGLEVKATYQDETQIILTSSDVAPNGDLIITGYNLNQAGNQKVYVYYEDFYITFDIIVHGDGEWSFSRVGNLSNPNRHHIIHNNGNVDGNINGSITMTSGEGEAQGRFGNNEESFIFYHLDLPQNSNFELSATATIDSMPVDSNPNQVAFGLLVKDDISNNSNGGSEGGALTNQSNYMAVGLSNGNMSAFYKRGSSENPNINTDAAERNINHNTRPDIIGSLGEPIVGFEYELKLQKFGEVYKLSISQEFFDNVYTQFIYVNEAEFINDIIHVGFFTARNIKVTYSDMSFKLIEGIEDISIQTLPYSTEFIIGDELDLLGLELLATMSDGSQKILGKEDVIVSGYQKNISGEQTLTIHYGDKTDTFTVNVKPIVYTGLVIDTYPIRRLYNVGEMLDTAGLVVKAQYEDLDGNLHTKNIDSNSYTLSTLDSSKPNTTQTITITLDEFPEIKTSFTVEITNLGFSTLSITKPLKTEYYVGDGENGFVEVDTRGMSVYAQFDQLTRSENKIRVDMNEITVSDLNTTTAGDIPVEVTWHNNLTQGRAITYTEVMTLTVLEAAPESLFITNLPQTTYFVGEELNLDGLNVQLKYNNGSKIDLLHGIDYQLNYDNFNTSLPGVYEIVITPTNSDLTSGLNYITFPVVVREEKTHIWEAIRFGQSTSARGNTVDFSNGEEGTSDGTFRLIADNRNPDSNPPNPGFSAGKITRGHDGITYYYTVLNSEEDNFEVSADFKVIEYSRASNANPTTGPTGHDGQESFGIMVRDSIAPEPNNAVFSSNIAAVGGFGSSTNDPNGFQGFIRTGVDNSSGTPGSTWEPKRINSMNAPDMEGNTYRLTLIKNNSGFIMKASGIGEDGIPFEDEVEFLLEENILNVQEGNTMYLGFYVARHAIVEVSNIDLKVTSVIADAPPVDIPQQPINVRSEFISLDKAGEESYVLQFQTNVGGTLSILGNGVNFNDYVEAGTISIPTTLEKGRNSFTAVFWPDTTANLTSYNRVVTTLDVDFQEFGENGKIIVSPNGVSTNKGTIESPIDLETAIAYVIPGQTIYMLEGNYNFTNGIRIPIGNNGTSEAMKKLSSHPNNEHPVTIDFLRQGNGFIVAGNWWHIYDINITRSRGNSHGLLIQGSNNIIESVTSHHNGGTGIQISAPVAATPRDLWPSYNLVLNCTAFGNSDPSENNADGFAAKLTVGPGNIFRGGIAFNNVDDGWDLYAKIETGPIYPVIVEKSLAFNNGTRMDGTRSTADGNGFKMGGEGVEVRHIVRDSVAFNNKNNGFTSNSNPWGVVTRGISFGNDTSGINYTTYTTIQDMLNFEIDKFISYDNSRADTVQHYSDNNNIILPSNFFIENVSGTLLSTNINGVEFTSQDFKALEMPFEHFANIRNGYEIVELLDTLRTGASDGINDNINWGNLWENFHSFMNQFTEITR